MKEAEIQIGCTYRVTNPIESRIATIKNKAELIASLHLNDQGRIEPILLDEDELVRLGFDKDTETTYRWFSGDNIAVDIDDFGVRVSNWWLDRKIETVHQLQQLFQALTRENLPYNEK